MNTEQRRALELSIEHWNDLTCQYESGVKEWHLDATATNCACCQYTAAQHGEASTLEEAEYFFGPCESYCPIAQYTNMKDCEGTPYYRSATYDGDPTEMRDWLRALLAGEQPPILPDSSEDPELNPELDP